MSNDQQRSLKKGQPTNNNLNGTQCGKRLACKDFFDHSSFIANCPLIN
jgi:hypothetical protein